MSVYNACGKAGQVLDEVTDSQIINGNTFSLTYIWNYLTTRKFGGNFANCIMMPIILPQHLWTYLQRTLPPSKTKQPWRTTCSVLQTGADPCRRPLACFEGKDYGEFHDIDKITMFAGISTSPWLFFSGKLPILVICKWWLAFVSWTGIGSWQVQSHGKPKRLSYSTNAAPIRLYALLSTARQSHPAAQADQKQIYVGDRGCEAPAYGVLS